ncbi:MAG: SdrD B-like domain-containing protein, partial [Pirellulaceae bacterium]
LGVSNGTLNSAAPLAQSGNSITLTGSIANVNAALATLTYTPSANFNGSDTLSVGVNDGNGGTANGTVGITVTAVNDNPTLTTPGPQQFFRDISNSLSSAISVADIDAGSSNIRVNLTIGTGTLAVAPTSNVQVASITNGISLTGSVANVNAALTSLTYTSGVSGNFTLSVAVNDLGNTGAGGGQDVTGTVAVEVLDFVPATITGTVFADLNNNGSQDADEMGLGGVEVTLSGRDFRNQVVQKVAITEADGSYSFTDIAPNQVGQPYTVTQTLPAFFQANSSTHSVSVNLQGQVTTTGGLSTGNLLPEFADYWDRLGRSIQAPFNSGLLFGFDDMIQDWSTIDGVGWDTSQFTNFRLTLSADGDSGVLTVFDKTIGQDRTRNVSLADGTLTYHGTDVDRIYRVVGSSSSLLGGAAVASMGEGSSVEETSSEEFAAAADVLFGRLGG